MSMLPASFHLLFLQSSSSFRFNRLCCSLLSRFNFVSCCFVSLNPHGSLNPSRQLTTFEKEALALGFKFDSGKDRYTLAEHVERNYKYNESDVDKGFIQGILTCCKALADSEPSSLPRRYILALKELANDRSIIVTQADKGGG